MRMPARHPSQASGLRGLFRRSIDHFRDTSSRSQAAARAIEQLATQRLARVITLRPLREAEVGAMLAALGRDEPPPPALTRKVWEHTGGNPLFTEELVRHLNEQGRLSDQSGRWKRAVDLDEVEVPATVRL